MAHRLGSDLAQHKGVYEHLDYLKKREALMQYPEFQNSGWPIGSGMVESANKNVVEARLKGTGMHSASDTCGQNRSRVLRLRPRSQAPLVLLCRVGTKKRRDAGRSR